MNHWVMDYETLSNCFVGVFQHYKTNERKVFIIHDLKDQFSDLLLFLKKNRDSKEWHISFNGLAFDAQISHFILDNEHLWMIHSACDIAKEIYTFAQSCIKKSNKKEYLKYPEWKMKINQIDLFKLNNWDNRSKSSSLKWIQFSLDWDNLLDMPIKHTKCIETKEEIDTIVDYCINDVESTKEIFNFSTHNIELRKYLSKKYDVNLFSCSETKVSKEIFMHYMSKKMKMSKFDFRKLKTERSIIVCKDIIFNDIIFKSQGFNNLLNELRKTTLDALNLKGQFNFSVEYKDVKTNFGLGGVHGAADSGIYNSDEEYIIMSSDVVSYYSSLIIQNKLSPKHFPVDLFCELNEWFLNQKINTMKSNPMYGIIKNVLNITYGLSNDSNSFFYDPELCMKITINGQLLLMMLYERIMEKIPGAVSLMQNTDGIEIKIPRVYKDKYLEICSEWEKETRLKLTHTEYKKLILADVNSYIAINEYKKVNITEWREVKQKHPHYLFKINGADFMYAKVKLKGRFNFCNLALHKNKSKLVVPKAIYQYFINDILPENYIKTNNNIFDYCIAQKSNSNWQQTKRVVTNGIVKDVPIQKTNRYYIGNDGYKIIKINKYDKRELNLESGKWKQKLFNKIEIKTNFNDYNINKKYYLESIKNEIDNILSIPKNQLKLF